MKNCTRIIELDGVAVSLHRLEDGRIWLLVDTSEAQEGDTHDGGVPRLRLDVNGDAEELDPSGCWVPLA